MQAKGKINNMSAEQTEMFIQFLRFLIWSVGSATQEGFGQR